MKHWWTLVAVLVAVALSLALGLSAPSIEAQSKNVLTAKKVQAEPAVDGALDAAWNGAQPLSVKAVGGKNLPGGSTEVTLRSVYTADTVYFHMQYKDPTQSFQRSPRASSCSRKS